MSTITTRKAKPSVSLLAGGTMPAIGLTLLTSLGLAAVVIPAAQGIQAIERKRAREWRPKARWFVSRNVARYGLKSGTNPSSEWA